MPAVVRYARQLLLHDQVLAVLENGGTVDEATGKARPEFAQMTALAKELQASERNLALSVRARVENLTKDERDAANGHYLRQPNVAELIDRAKESEHPALAAARDRMRKIPLA
jgi:hypothetical protein